jgi:hypothetical protein
VILNLIKGFFYIYWDDQVVFVFASIMCCYYIYLLVYVELPLHPWDEANFFVVNNLSDICWIQFAIILLRSFALMFIKEIGPWFSFLEVSLSGFGMSVILAS